jgi:hypothetical protein
MPVTIDKFEYATDTLAQAAWMSVVIASGLPTNSKLFIGFQQVDAKFIDEGDLGLSITNNGVTYSSAGKYGGAGLFDASGYIAVPYNAALNIGSGDFCISGWFSRSTISYQHIIGTTTSGNFTIALNFSGYGISIGTHSGPWTVNVAYTFAANTIYHIEVSRSSGRTYIFVNGVLLNSGGTVDTNSYVFANGFMIGKHNDTKYLGTMSEFCIQVGTGGHISDFTPPTSYIVALIPVYSEATIKHTGDYSTKIVALQTTSLNKTITRTVSPTINLTDQDNLKIWVRASRTGTNLKIGFHDSGGTTTESNIAISSADTFEEKTIDISTVANANKDAIDSIIITITNADAENTIYLDEMLGYVKDEGTGGGGITNAINVSILTPSGWQKGI